MGTFGTIVMFIAMPTLAWFLAKWKNRTPLPWAVAAFCSAFFPIVPIVLLVIRRKARTLNEYLNLYPNTKTARGLSCAFCGSTSIRAVGIRGPMDANKLHSCNHCGAQLYET